VVAAVEQCLEGPVTEHTLKELIDQEAHVKPQAEEDQVYLEAFKAAMSGPE
jgi:hypothetical protein